MTSQEAIAYRQMEAKVGDLTLQLAAKTALLNARPVPVAPPVIQNSSENNQALLTLLKVGNILGFPGDQHILDLPAFATALMAKK